MVNYFDLSGRVAVVTGGLGQLGQQFSSALASYGALVAVIDVRKTDKKMLDLFGTHLAEKRIRVFEADIVKKNEIEAALENIRGIWRDPEILINNAALDSPPDSPPEENGPFETYPEYSLDRILDVNVKGMFLCCQVFGGEMARQGKGSIINISSIYGVVSPNQDIYEYRRRNGVEWYKPPAYSVSKSGILNLTRYLATYWAKKGVRVNTLTPAGIFNNQDKEFLEEYCKRIPIGRMANPDELNGAVIYLASDASSYMTGANLVVDGGWTAW